MACDVLAAVPTAIRGQQLMVCYWPCTGEHSQDKAGVLQGVQEAHDDEGEAKQTVHTQAAPARTVAAYSSRCFDPLARQPIVCLTLLTGHTVQDGQGVPLCPGCVSLRVPAVIWQKRRCRHCVALEALAMLHCGSPRTVCSAPRREFSVVSVSAVVCDEGVGFTGEMQLAAKTAAAVMVLTCMLHACPQARGVTTASRPAMVARPSLCSTRRCVDSLMSAEPGSGSNSVRA